MKQACAVAALIGLLVVSFVAPSPAGAQGTKRALVFCSGDVIFVITCPDGQMCSTTLVAGPLPHGCPPGLEQGAARNANIFCVVGADVATLTFQLGDDTTADLGSTNTVTTVLSQVNIDALTFQLGVPPASPFATALCQ